MSGRGDETIGYNGVLSDLRLLRRGPGGTRVDGSLYWSLVTAQRVQGEGAGSRDIERPENSPVDCFQRDGAGRPLGTGIVAAARSDKSIGTENTATAFFGSISGSPANPTLSEDAEL